MTTLADNVGASVGSI